MSWLSRGPAVPSEVARRASGRVLAAAEASGGTWLVGTRDAFVAVGGDTTTIPWERVLRADWDSDCDAFRIERVEAYGEPVTVLSFVLPEPGALLDLVRERVTASVVLQRRVDLGRRRGFRVMARRAPAGSGEITWAHEFDPGVDLADPAVRAAADEALAEAKEALGL